MKRYSIFFLFALLYVTVVPARLPWVDGSYNRVSRTIWCRTEYACIHEVGHKIDHESGWISHTSEFLRAVQVYVPYTIESGFLSRNLEEIYAELFARSEGVSENMPERLRPFYDWERAAELIEKVMR